MDTRERFEAGETQDITEAVANDIGIKIEPESGARQIGEVVAVDHEAGSVTIGPPGGMRRREAARRPLVDGALRQAAQLVEQCRRAGRPVPEWWPALAPLNKLERARVRQSVAMLLAQEAA